MGRYLANSAVIPTRILISIPPFVQSLQLCVFNWGPPTQVSISAPSRQPKLPSHSGVAGRTGAPIARRRKEVERTKLVLFTINTLKGQIPVQNMAEDSQRCF